jgi:SAM-dependent methyltransferase
MGSFDASKDQKSQLLKGMDKTMAQKLAFTSAHFQLSDGARILDVGCGTGYGSYQFALFNPHLHVVALDYDRDYIERARQQYPLANLTFVQGDARNFDAGGEKFDAIFNSSILHEVFSFSGYSQQAVTDSLQAQMNNVRDGGIILIRDFVRPDHPEAMVYLDLPDEASKGEDPKDLSVQDMLRLYADWACAEKPVEQRGFFLEHRAGEAEAGWQRFYLQHDWANEFILRKDYRERFFIEAKEKYGYFTPKEYRSIPESLGARVIYTSPYSNPWIVENRMKGKLRLFNENRDSMCLPATNFVCVMQKVPAHHGVVVHEHKVSGHDLQYLKTESFRHSRTNEVNDLVSRPGRVFDLLPYYVHPSGKVDIYARSDYPRPLVNVVPRQMSPRVDGKTWSGYMVEPFAIANQTDDVDQAAKKALMLRAGIHPSVIESIETGPDYYPALKDVNERVGSAFIRLNQDIGARDLSAGYSGFQENGALRPFALQDMLRGIQVGMFPEARLELNAYRLAHKLNVPLPEWMGHSYQIHAVSGRADSKPPISKLVKPFVPSTVPANDRRGVRSIFTEETSAAKGAKVVAQRELEFVMPGLKAGQDMSNNMAVVIPVIRAATGVLMVGLKPQSFPALQEAGESAQRETLDIQRLGSRLKTLDDVYADVAAQFDVDAGQVKPLGEGYFPSMGIMPDRAYPVLVNIGSYDNARDYHFVPLSKLVAKVDELRDAHLMLAVYRLDHALNQGAVPQVKLAARQPSP